MLSNIKKYIIFALILILISHTPIFSQEEQTPQLQDKNIVVTLGPLGILNTQENSAPSPINISIGAGAEIPLLEEMSIAPHANFFGNYALWYRGQVLPAEIEHRSLYIPSLLIDVPVTYDIKHNNSIFRMGGGVALLFRFAMITNDAPASAVIDIGEVNQWLWDKGRFIYPSLHFSWDYVFQSGLMLGLGAKAYLPVSSLFTGFGLTNGMASISLRFIPSVRF